MIMKKRGGKRGNTGCWGYVKESKNYLLIVSAIFLFTFLVGFFFPVFFADMVKEFIDNLIAKTEGMGFLQLFLFIFKNNLMTAFSALLFGVVFGLFPLILTILNGYILGFVAGRVFLSSGFFSLWRLLPHGIFELPALIISLSLGLRLGMFIFAKEGKRKKVFLYNLKNSFKAFLYVILPLLLIAAFIETCLMFWLG